MSWNHLEKSIEGGPRSASFAVFKVLAIVMFIGFGLSAVGHVMGWFGEAAQVAKAEFGPKAALAKYEWFKNAAAELDKKQADIKVYSKKLSLFTGVDRKDMDRTDKEQLSQWHVELAGVTAAYNGLAAEWNSQKSKFNWKVFEGDLPIGATDLLSREYAPYIGE